eukprot:COSAG06_NODE_45717_length_352_cov_1.403162_1_plen_44_part_01
MGSQAAELVCVCADWAWGEKKNIPGPPPTPLPKPDGLTRLDKLA